MCGVRGALVLRREAFDVLLQFLKGHGVDSGYCALTAGHDRRIGGSQQLPGMGPGPAQRYWRPPSRTTAGTSSSSLCVNLQ